MKGDPRAQPVVRCEFRLPTGTVLIRTWTMAEKPPDMRKPPAWLEDPERKWGHPQDPVLMLGRVKPGHEDEARAFLDMK